MQARASLNFANPDALIARSLNALVDQHFCIAKIVETGLFVRLIEGYELVYISRRSFEHTKAILVVSMRRKRRKETNLIKKTLNDGDEIDIVLSEYSLHLRILEALHNNRPP